MMIFIFSIMFSFLFTKLIKINIFNFMQNYMMINLLLFLIFNKISFLNYKFFWNFYLDYYSFYLVLMTIWIISLMFLTSMNINFKFIYIFNLLTMLMSLMFTFMSINYFLFYLYFEISMIPTLLLIIGWGMQYERMEAGMYMIMYTLFASLPMMIILIKIYNLNNNLNMILLNNINLINNIYMYIYLLLAFLIKMPMFFFHLWLPKAHVEAPITGSMILAAIMLKLGSYGMLRIMMLMEKICMKFNLFIMIFSLMGSMYISIICLQQMDMKMLIAYSSVVHMGMTITSLMTLNYWGYKGALIMMISHGLTSSSLFFLVNINYERLMSRSLFINKGLMNIMPSLTLFWFLLSIFNTASPPSLNLFSEIMMINSILSWNMMFLLIIMILAMTNVVYMMFLFSSSQHGIIYKNLNYFSFINLREYLILYLHLIPILILITLF
uniref:NADH-ubiquinone oxidoreductase chain 4 n=1 Tax=Melanips sp. ZJUH 20220003 TaxID=2943452 RepID=A0A9E8K0C6_9HYME|nr:NADH dehydrogenase subunit 4 [Melanips sp. ZJUH 20220003]